MRREGDNMTGLKRQNRAAVLLSLSREGGLSRKRLSGKLGLTPAAMTKIAAELIAEGLVREDGLAQISGVGRREITLSIDPHARCALGVMLGLGKATLSAVSLDGSVLFSETVPLSVRANAERTVQLLSGGLLRLADEHGLSRERIVGVGIAVRGTIGANGRIVKNSFDALDTPDFPICDRFETHTGMKTILSNNVRALLAAQLFFDREPEDTGTFFVRCGSGIGAAFSVGGEILPGDRNRSAEIGHIPVVRRGGRPCHCGKSGCLETVASPAAIVEQAKELFSRERTPLLYRLAGGNADAVTVNAVLDAARVGDAGAAGIADRAAESLADALKSVIYLLDPGRIVLYGPVFSHPYFYARLEAEAGVGVDALHAVPIEKSRFSGRLEESAAGLLCVMAFYRNGGMDA